ncbi:histidine kinase [Saccharothrix yanglingensis]|uniref:histidine kinase n=1 Tax=Saccharothrix yanglingensis TaxID=659496 RepID=A0ABU0X5L9_9PSEU|nr:histidine kinase [Saccharothrix yanglingensis]
MTPAVTVKAGLTPHVLVLLCAVASGLAATAVRRVWWPVAVVGSLAWLTASMWPALVLASYTVGTRQRRTSALVVCGALGGLVVGAPLTIGSLAKNKYLWEAPLVSVGLAALVVWLPMLLGSWRVARRELLDQFRERAERAEREQILLAQQARADERARIGRELHDVVAHRVSLMVLQAGALEVGTGDERAAHCAQVIRETGRDVLTELRQVLGLLRTPGGDVPLTPLPTLADLDALLRESRAAGIPVVRREVGELTGIPAAIGRTAYRVVQEGLTNVAKHAGTAATAVELRRTPTELEVVVRNDRPAVAVAAPPTSGYGLVGLRERVELLGGWLRAEPVPDGGFTVSARLPLGARP